MLSGSGYRVDTVLDGAAAVAATAARPYDAILMDCQMPELNGYEATAAIRAREGSDRHTPIIALTAGARPEDRDRCLAESMDAYLAKPVSKDALVALVARWVKPGSACGVRGVARSGPHAPPLLGGANDGTPARGEPELIAQADIAALDDLGGGLLPGLLALFFDEAAGLISELGLAVGCGEAATVSQSAHKLKGSSGAIGAARVSHIAAALETTARTGDMSAADELLERLRGALAQTEEAFTSSAVAACEHGDTASS